MGDFTQGIGMDSRICLHFLTIVNSKWNEQWSQMKCYMCPSSEWKFLRAIWAKEGILMPKFSGQKKPIWYGKEDRGKTLLGEGECHGLPSGEEEVQALPSASPNL